MGTTQWVGGVCAIFALTGCTQLTHDKVADMDTVRKPGFSYYLPRQSYSVSVTYELTACDASEVSISQTAMITELSQPDPDQHYHLSYEDLDNWLKTTTFSASVYPNKTIKSVGASIEDRTGAIAKSVVGASISVAKMALGLPAAAKVLCNGDTIALLTAKTSARAKLTDPASDDKARAAAAAAMTAARNLLQIQKQVEFTPSMGSRKLAAPIKLSDDELGRWLSGPQGSRDATVAAGKREALDRFERSITTDIRVVGGPDTYPPSNYAAKGEGIVYRDPHPARIEICVGACSDTAEKVAVLDTQIAQLGRTNVITLSNGLFDKNNLTLSFAANGQIDSMIYGTESRLEKMAGALADTTTQVGSFLDKRRAAEAAEDQAQAQSELTQIKAQTTLLNAKSDLIQAKQKLTALGGE